MLVHASGSPPTASCPNASCGRTRRPSATAWRTPDSSRSPTTAGRAYYATYTAFDGANIAQSLLTTDDFVTFAVSPMAGHAARGKGLALFPRQIDGRYAALTRADRETNSIAYSDDMRCWDSTRGRPDARVVRGRCSSSATADRRSRHPTAGSCSRTASARCGPTRSVRSCSTSTNPTGVIAELDRPFLTPGPRARGLRPQRRLLVRRAPRTAIVLVVPYGVGDQTIAIATLSVSELISAMQPIHTKEPR